MSKTIFGALFNGDWEDYHKNGIVPNLWAGITGQKSAEIQTDMTNQLNKELNEQNNLANKEIAEMNNLANLEQVNRTNESNRLMNEATNQANRDIAEKTNKTNLDIANQNLGFQREVQEYNKALQDKIFEREDTSYQRTKADMLAAGLNPLSMAGTNGSGSVVSVSPMNNSFQAQTGAPMSASTDIAAQFGAPIMNAHKNELAPRFSPMEAISALTSVMSGFDSVETSKLNRDALQLENDKQFLENFEKAHNLGINYNSVGGNGITKRGSKNNLSSKLSKEQGEIYNYTSGSSYVNSANQIREYNNKVDKGLFDSDMPFERAVTRIEKLLDDPEELNRRLSNLGKNSLSFLNGIFGNTLR